MELERIQALKAVLAAYEASVVMGFAGNTDPRAAWTRNGADPGDE